MKDSAKRSIIWGACNLPAWLHLLARQQYDFDRSLWPLVLRTTAKCAVVSALGFVQELIHGAAVRRTQLREAPLFVLGHWRSGTTYLHDLFSLDERYTFATNLDCLSPDHFLLTGDLIRRWKGTAAQHRPMDNVKLGLDTPQEDEIALCMMGVPSPYLDPAFPNRPQVYQDYLDMEGLAPRDREAWKRKWRRFLQRLTYKRPGRLLLKSPTHTARIRVLLEMFPDARFVHIVRDPYTVFLSMRKLAQALRQAVSLQAPPYPAVDENIFAAYIRLMRRLEDDRALVDPARFYEVRYEDVAADPVNQVQAIYQHLGLGGFDRLRPRLERYLAELGPYRPNHHQMSPEVHAEITKRWGPFIRKFGYETEPPTTAAVAH